MNGGTIVLIGASGFVGSRFVELYGGDNFITPASDELDLGDQESMSKFVERNRPDVFINFGAITDVDGCERERENRDGLVWRVNALAPRLLSRLSRERNFFLVHISTDMVFPGIKEDPGPYDESHPLGMAGQLTWYGASKAEGERAVLGENRNNAVVRIIYPVRASFAGKLDYMHKILKLYDDGKLYPMFVDQYINITFIDELAEALKVIVERRSKGIHHVATSDMTTPYEFADYLLKKARGAENVVQKASFEEFIEHRDRRRYPHFGGLRVEKTEKRLGMAFSGWREVVNKLIL